MTLRFLWYTAAPIYHRVQKMAKIKGICTKVALERTPSLNIIEASFIPPTTKLQSSCPYLAQKENNVCVFLMKILFNK